MSFTAEYQLTFEEYKEAMTHIRRSAMAHQLGMRTSKTGGLFGWVLFIGLAVLLFILLNRGGAPTPVPKGPTPTRPDILDDIVLTFVPWLIIFGFVWFFIFRRIRGQFRRTWDQTPQLHRVRTITVTDAGLHFVDATSEHTMTWAHYESFVETPHLFLLYITKSSAELIAKRIFTNPADIDQFRDLLHHNISSATKAFPVIPLAKE